MHRPPEQFEYAQFAHFGHNHPPTKLVHCCVRYFVFN